MKTLSTGMPSTLKSYKQLTAIFFGKGSPQAEFIDTKIAESPNGEDEEVIAAESQVLYLLASLPARSLP